MKELRELVLFAPNLPSVEEVNEEVNEVGFVGAGIGGGFEQTGELKASLVTMPFFHHQIYPSQHWNSSFFRTGRRGFLILR
jgi:hypothetical protein